MSLAVGASFLSKAVSVHTVCRVSSSQSVGAMRYRSSGRVRNAWKAYRKAESIRQMRNIEGRVNHTQLVDEQRAGKLERKAEKARQHAELLERHRVKKQQRLATEGPSAIDENRSKVKIEKRALRTARRDAARAIILEANERLREIRAAHKPEVI